MHFLAWEHNIIFLGMKKPFGQKNVYLYGKQREFETLGDKKRTYFKEFLEMKKTQGSTHGMELKIF